MERVLAVLLGVLALSPAARAGAESFHIAPHGAPYTTNTVFSSQTRYHVTVSGAYFANEGSATTAIDAYHCVSGSLCEDGRDPLHIVASPFHGQNFAAFREDGLGIPFSPSPYPPLSGDTKYAFDLFVGADGDHLTFSIPPDQVGGYYPYTSYGPGFDFTVTEVVARKRVRFGFDVDGFPDTPAPDHLPGNLTSVALETSDTELKGDTRNALTGSGVIRMRTTYLQPDLDTETRRITFELDDQGATAEYSDEGGERSVTFPAEVTGSTDPRCRRFTPVEFVLAGGGGKAVLAMRPLPDHRCLSEKALGWRKRGKFKRARISKLE